MTQLAPSSPTNLTSDTAWTPVCKIEDILPGGGVCALVGGRQVAVFRVAGQVYALSNFDPFTRANVLSRGLAGSYTVSGQDGQARERYKVASPLLKHAFDLETGACLSDPAVSVPVYAARTEEDRIWIGEAWTGSRD